MGIQYDRAFAKGVECRNKGVPVHHSQKYYLSDHGGRGWMAGWFHADRGRTSAAQIDKLALANGYAPGFGGRVIENHKNGCYEMPQRKTMRGRGLPTNC